MQLIQPPPSLPRRQRGLTLIESLIALIVAALGILGIIGVQMRTLADTQTSLRRAQAIRLIEDLDERLKVTPGALVALGKYVSARGTSPTGGDCTANCDPTQLAAFDLADWKQTVKRVLPLGDADIFLAPGEAGNTTNSRLLGVMISWRENESYVADSTYLTNIDATQVRDATGNLTSGLGAATTCPTGRTCHLQYISATNRCVPDLGNGSDPTDPTTPSPEFYCAD